MFLKRMDTGELATLKNGDVIAYWDRKIIFFRKEEEEWVPLTTSSSYPGFQKTPSPQTFETIVNIVADTHGLKAVNCKELIPNFLSSSISAFALRHIARDRKKMIPYLFSPALFSPV